MSSIDYLPPVIYTLLFILSTLLVLLGQNAWACRRSFQTFLRLGIPGPKPRFFVGNVIHPWTCGKELLELMARWVKDYGDVFGYFNGNEPFLVLNDLHLIKQVALKKFSYFADRPPFCIPIWPVIGGLAFSKGKKWRNMRNAVSPAFGSPKIKLTTTALNKHIDIFLDLIGNGARNRKPFDFHHAGLALSLECISDVALAIGVNCQRNPKDPFFNSIIDFFVKGANTAVAVALLFPPLAKFMALVYPYTAPGKFNQTIMDELQKEIKRRKCNIGNIHQKEDLLQRMDPLDAKSKFNKLNDDEVMCNAYTFLLAGFETTGSTLAFAFYLVASHPEVQERLNEEVAEIDRPPTFEQVTNLPYLDQVVREVLRLYPTLSIFTTRMCIEDCVLEGGPKVPKGVTVCIPTWLIHHDPRYYPDPWTFDPERFNTINKQTLDPAASLAFGLGPRGCPGFRLAILEVKLALARVIQDFRITPSVPGPFEFECPNFTLKPKGSVLLKAEFRDTPVN